MRKVAVCFLFLLILPATVWAETVKVQLGVLNGNSMRPVMESWQYLMDDAEAVSHRTSCFFEEKYFSGERNLGSYEPNVCGEEVLVVDIIAQELTEGYYDGVVRLKVVVSTSVKKIPLLETEIDVWVPSQHELRDATILFIPFDRLPKGQEKRFLGNDPLKLLLAVVRK